MRLKKNKTKQKQETGNATQIVNILYRQSKLFLHSFEYTLSGFIWLWKCFQKVKIFPHRETENTNGNQTIAIDSIIAHWLHLSIPQGLPPEGEGRESLDLYPLGKPPIPCLSPVKT